MSYLENHDERTLETWATQARVCHGAIGMNKLGKASRALCWFGKLTAGVLAIADAETAETLICSIAEGSSMIEGLWIVQYEGTAGSGGSVIVFVQRRVLGGDSAYVYTGTYERDGDKISARVLVRNFNPAIGNVLGVKGDFELTVEGTIQGDIIKGSASLVNREGPGIVVKLTKVASLAA